MVLFVAQPLPLPPTFAAEEERACAALFRGPANWVTVEALMDVTSLHFPWDFPDLPSAAMAARARVARFENSAHGGLKVRERAKTLRRISLLPGNRARAAERGELIQDCVIFHLEAATEALSRAEATQRASPSLLDPACPDALKKEGWQARATRVFKNAARHSAAAHVRSKLDRWRLPTLPGHRPRAWMHSLYLSAPLLPPRVQACQLRTAWNGWCTARRFQGVAGCILGCKRGEDSIEHYAFCSCFHTLCKKHLGLSRPPPEACLGDFLGVLPCPSSLPPHLRTGSAVASAAALRALGVYALYKVQNGTRHGLPRGDGPEAFRGFLRGAVLGHPPSQSLLRSVFKRPRGDS